MTAPARRTPNGDLPQRTQPVADLVPKDGRVPPHDLDAEAAVLSAVILQPAALAAVRTVLAPQQFYAEANRRIFTAVSELADTGRSVDLVTLAAWLRDRERLASVGGLPYLAQLADGTPHVGNVLEHAALVATAARRRQLIATCQTIAAEGYGDVGPIEEFFAQAAQRVQDAIGPVTRTVVPKPATSVDVLAQWREHGPLVHEPTGLAALDELTGGGPCYGTRWYIAGAPDAGKTALLVQLAHVYALRGICVGLLAVDEEPSDLVTRLAQRAGWARQHCEIRDAAVLDDVSAAIEHLPIRYYDEAWTIESAAADLAAWAAREQRTAMLGIDSVQTVRCVAEDVVRLAGREMSDVAAVTARCRAIRAVATEHRLIALATSELGRSAYASRDPSQRTSALAAGKWSGAIEYSARVVAALRSVPGESDLLELELAKNKHGPVTYDDGEPGHVYLRIDRRSQTLTQASYEPAPDCQVDRARDRVLADAAIVAKVLSSTPGMVRREVEAHAMAAGLGRERARAALAALAPCLVVLRGQRRAEHHYLAGDRVPQVVMGHIADADRDLVQSARPPVSEPPDV